MVAEATAKVTRIEEGRATYRMAQGQERPTFTGIPDWLYVYMPRLSRGIGWNLLSIILHHQRMCERDRPVAISLQQLSKETGNAKPAVLRGLKALADVGLLYEELEDPTHRDSAICYAIQEEPGQGVVEEADGSLSIHLLGGWYEVDPTRLLHRDRISHPGGIKTLPPQKERVGGNETLPPRSRNVTTCGNETLPPPSREARQEAETQFAIKSNREIESNSADATSQETQPTFSDSHAQHVAESPSWLSENRPGEQHTLFGEEVTPTLPVSKPSRSKPKKATLADDPLVQAWLAAANRRTKPTESELRDWERAINDLKAAEPPATPEEMPRLVAQYRTWRDSDGKPYRLRHPRVLARNLNNLREELAVPSKPIGTLAKPPSVPGLAMVMEYTDFTQRESGQACIPVGL